MDPRELIWFLRRLGWVLVGTVILVVGLAWGWSASQSTQGREALIFLTLGMDLTSEALNPNEFPDNVDEITDSFTETVQGWFFNPAFSQTLNERIGEPVGLSARKQEQQNLMVTLSLPETVESEAASAEFLALLEEEIARYNEATRSSFVVALHSVTVSESTVSHGIYAMVAGVLGFVIVCFGVLTVEYLRGRLTFVAQAEAIMGHSPLKRILSSRSTLLKSGLEVVRALHPDRQGWVMVDASSKGTVAHLQHFPQDLAKLDPQAPVILWVRLGHTSEEALQEARAYWGQKTPWIATF